MVFDNKYSTNAASATYSLTITLYFLTPDISASIFLTAVSQKPIGKEKNKLF